MGRLCAMLLVLALACGMTALAAAAPGSLGGRTAAAHPEPGDVDGDEIRDEVDNCPFVPNGNQDNADGDAAGDSCDDDDDNEGVIDAVDNCRVVANPDQLDSDGNGRGDACPAVDSDGDGRIDEDDNCRQAANADQADFEGDGKGDVCDRDDDNDKYDDAFDNCPRVFNPDQIDLDGDKTGSACDADERIAPEPGTGGGPTTGSSAAPTAAADRRAPRVRLRIQRRHRMAEVGSSLIVAVSCSESCALEAVLSVDAAAARRAGLGRTRVVLARGAWALGSAGRTYVFARWTRAARRLATGRRVAARLALTATDAAGNDRKVSRRLELRR